MASKRTFYRTVIQYEVLSEEPIRDDISLEEIADQCADGEWSGRFLCTSPQNQRLTGEEAAMYLGLQGSDPAFFQLTDTGEDLDG